MADDLINEINGFVETLDEAEEKSDSKKLIDNFISYNDATIQEINQFIDLLQDWEDDEEEEREKEEETSQELAEQWEESKNEIACVLEDSAAFISESFRRRYLGNGISILIGILKSSDNVQVAIHSFKFDKNEPHNWSMDRAKDWYAGKKVIDNSTKLSKNLKYVEIKDIKIKQVLKEKAGLRITGVAISEGVWNGIFYPADELEKGHESLNGRPLKVDHSPSARDIIGKVIKSAYVPEKKWIEFEAIVTDEEIIKKLLDKLIDSVSVGVLIDAEEEDGRQIARNLEFKELSLVDDPACKDSKIKSVKD